MRNDKYIHIYTSSRSMLICTETTYLNFLNTRLMKHIQVLIFIFRGTVAVSLQNADGDFTTLEALKWASVEDTRGRTLGHDGVANNAPSSWLGPVRPLRRLQTRIPKSVTSGESFVGLQRQTLQTSNSRSTSAQRKIC